MSVFGVVLALLVLAAVTRIGTAMIERVHAPQGRMIDVTGGRLHVVDLGPRETASVPIVLIHGASSNLQSMRQPLGDLLSRNHRVIIIDRPGHGFSTRDSLTSSTPEVQARMIDEALGKLGIKRAIVVGHSWGGAVVPALAINNPARVAGIVLLAPVTHPWNGGVSWYHGLGAMPLIGWLFAHTLALPAGVLMINAGARGAFLPQAIPEGYVRATALALLLRPAEFLANAWDMATLKQAVTQQVARYGEIKAPVIILHGDFDRSVRLDTHSRKFAQAVPHTELIILPGVGHLIQNAATENVISAIERLVLLGAASAQAPGEIRIRDTR